MSHSQQNPFLLAADDSPHLLPLLRSNPRLASSQDEHGYSLIHAAASYDHLSLLRTLVTEFDVPVDLKDEDGETALFVVETVDCARVLAEELHADINLQGADNKTAREKIQEEGEFPEVAAYLLSLEHVSNGVHLINGANGSEGTTSDSVAHPPLPEGVSINIGTMSAEELEGEVVDMELRRRIEELASRADFQGEEGQRELRDLITQVLRTQAEDEREVRQRID